MPPLRGPGFADMKRIFVLLALWLGLAGPATAQQEPEILHFHADIRVQPDGSLDVTETIRVRTDGDKLRHGFERQLRTSHARPDGSHARVRYRILEATRDGAAQTWNRGLSLLGLQVFLGRENVLLEPGIYTYRLRYATNRQIQSEKTHEELYWDVICCWYFTSARASAAVHLPGGVPAGQIVGSAFTGMHGGGVNSDAQTSHLPSGMRFQTTRALESGQGLAVQLRWPSGYLITPSLSDRVRWLWRDEPGFVVLVLSIPLALACLLLARWRSRRAGAGDDGRKLARAVWIASLLALAYAAYHTLMNLHEVAEGLVVWVILFGILIRPHVLTSLRMIQQRRYDANALAGHVMVMLAFGFTFIYVPREMGVLDELYTVPWHLMAAAAILVAINWAFEQRPAPPE